MQLKNWISEHKALRKRFNSHYLKGLSWRVVRTIMLAGLVFMILYPLFVQFISSIKSASDLGDPTVIFFPKNPTIVNYRVLFDAIEYPTAFLYTAVFNLAMSALQIASCVMVSYGLARFKFKGRGLVFALSLFTLIVPPQTIMFPMFLRFKYFNPLYIFKLTGSFSAATTLNLTGTWIPFLLLSLTAIGFKNGLFIFMQRQYFRNQPVAIEEAAYVDGCGPFRTFVSIMLPGALPIILTTFLLSFVWGWNDMFYTQALAPELPLLASKMFGVAFEAFSTGSPVMDAYLENAKLFLLIFPLIILYIFTQRHFTESIERSGLVG
ncbi:MAG: carbohydrate ABC transporter permease [Clostridia bacterium]|nr:carbohydrate ABC transporter permease [Clostridia bacterium]